MCNWTVSPALLPLCYTIYLLIMFIISLIYSMCTYCILIITHMLSYDLLPLCSRAGHATILPRQRDNVTMFSGQKIDDYRYHIISIFVVATPFRHGSVLIPIVGGTWMNADSHGECRSGLRVLNCEKRRARDYRSGTYQPEEHNATSN